MLRGEGIPLIEHKKLPNFKVPHFQIFKVSSFQVSKYQSFKVPIFNISKLQSFKAPKIRKRFMLVDRGRIHTSKFPFHFLSTLIPYYQMPIAFLFISIDRICKNDKSVSVF